MISVLKLQNKGWQAGRLKQQQLIFSRFWRIKVCDQGFGRSGFFQGLSPWLLDGHLLPCFHMAFLCAHSCPDLF